MVQREMREENKRLRERGKGNRQELLSLAQIGDAFASAAATETVLITALERLMAIDSKTGPRSMAVALIDFASARLRCLAAAGPRQSALAGLEIDLGRLSPALVRANLEQGLVTGKNESRRGPVFLLRRLLLDAPSLAGAAGLAVLPLLARGRLVGLLIAVPEAGQNFAGSDWRLWSTAASQFALVVENALLMGEVKAKDELRGKLLDRVMTSQEQQSKNLVEDIHDEILQALATSLYKIDLACRLSELNEPERALAEMHVLRRSLAENIDRLHNLIFDLRPSTLDTLGLLPTLDSCLYRFEEESGASTLLRSAIGQRLSPALETMVYRLVKSALDNVRLHAKASAVFVSLNRIADMVRVVIEDNGMGFHPEEALQNALQKGNMGLASMRERVQMAGGYFHIDSSPGDGTRVIFALPFQSSGDAAANQLGAAAEAREVKLPACS